MEQWFGELAGRSFGREDWAIHCGVQWMVVWRGVGGIICQSIRD